MRKLKLKFVTNPVTYRSVKRQLPDILINQKLNFPGIPGAQRPYT